MKHTLSILLFFLIFIASAGNAPQCWMRVTLLEASPETESAFTGMLAFTLPHVFLKKAAWGADGKIVSFPTDFHAVMNWDALENAGEQKIAVPGPWIDLSEIFHMPSEGGNRWLKTERRCHAVNLCISFFARGNDRRTDRRPIFKRLEAGNLERIRVKAEFASAPDERAIFRVITEQVTGSCFRLMIDPEIRDVNLAFASVTDILARRISALEKQFGQAVPPPKRILISRRENPGHFYPLLGEEAIRKFHELHRLLGIRSVQYNSVEMSRKQRELLWSQSDPVFLEGTRPEWISSEPSDPDLKKKCIASARRLPVVPGKALLVKFGDETRVLSGALLKKAGVRKQFADFLKARKILPDEVGFPSYGDIEILDNVKKAVTPAFRRLFYYSSIFRSEAQLDWYRAMVNGIRAAYPGKLISTGEICWENSRVFPEIFRAFEKNVFDVASHECSVLLWLMPHSAISRLVAQRSAARYFRTRPGILYGSYRGGEKLYDIIEVDGTSALMNGMEHIYWYSDTSFGPNGFPSEKYHAQIMKVNRRAARFENLILDGESPSRAPLALLVKSYASEFWQGSNGLPHYAEFDMAAAGLAWNQLPFDILSDELAVRFRDNYRIIYLASRILPSGSREPLKKWVETGGRLVFLGSSAATRNEFNEEESFLGGWMRRVPSSDAVIPIGKGKVFFFSESPAQKLRNSFRPLDKALPVASVFHTFDPALLAPYAAPFDAAPALPRGVLCDRPGVEVNYFESADRKRSAVFAVDYTSGKEKKITLKIMLKGNYHAAEDETGRRYPLRRGEDGRTVLPELPLGASAVYSLE